jgi:hypothetical protein
MKERSMANKLRTLRTPSPTGHKNIGAPRSPAPQISVTDDHIKRGKMADSTHCMIAEAIKSAVPGAKRVAVDLQTVRFSDARRPLRYVYLTPPACQDALIQFDQGVLPRPFEFKLRGAHVLAAGSRRLAEPRTRHERSARTRDRRAARRLRKARIVSRNRTLGTLGVVGGRAAPISRFARIRRFGIRALGKPSPALMALIRSSGQDLLTTAQQETA